MKPLYLTAHYDDMEVGAGGTATRFGGTSIVLYPREDKGNRKEAERAADILGVQLTKWIGPVTDRAAVAQIDSIVKSEGIDTIISTSPYDSHPEHQKVASLARQVARKNNVSLWWMDHAIPGGMGNGPRPNMFVTFDDPAPKAGAIDCYEVMNGWHRPILARDAYYGSMVGAGHAEGFIVEHGIIGETK